MHLSLSINKLGIQITESRILSLSGINLNKPSSFLSSSCLHHSQVSLRNISFLFYWDLKRKELWQIQIFCNEDLKEIFKNWEINGGGLAKWVSRGGEFETSVRDDLHDVIIGTLISSFYVFSVIYSSTNGSASWFSSPHFSSNLFLFLRLYIFSVKKVRIFLLLWVWFQNSVNQFSFLFC